LKKKLKEEKSDNKTTKGRKHNKMKKSTQRSIKRFVSIKRTKKQVTLETENQRRSNFLNEAKSRNATQTSLTS